MSFDINWDNLTSDTSINESIRQFLNSQFQSIELPSYVSNLKITDFNLGSIPPQVTIRHIGDVFEEFYNQQEEQEVGQGSNMNKEKYSPPESDSDSDSDSDSESSDHESIYPLPQTIKPNPPPLIRSKDSFQSQSILHPFHIISNTGSETPTNILNPQSKFNKILPKTKKSRDRDESDIQMILEIDYKGDLYLNILVTLLINYPSPNFISLPIKLHITDIVIHSIATIAYLKNCVYLSFLCDVNEFDNIQSSTNSSSPNGGNFVDYFTNNPDSNKERIDIIKKIKIESEIGEMEQNVLRNVSKIEKFLMEQLRNILRDEIAWPSWICIDLNEEEEEEA